MTEQRFYCEQHSVTHKPGECGVCSLISINKEHQRESQAVLDRAIASNISAEANLCRLMQEADVRRVSGGN